MKKNIIKVGAFFIYFYLVLILVTSCSHTSNQIKNTNSESDVVNSVTEEVLIGRAVAAKLCGLYGLYDNEDMLEFLVNK